MLPFIGTAHIGYLLFNRIVGMSKLARVLEHFAHRPQIQERLTTQIADVTSRPARRQRRRRGDRLRAPLHDHTRRARTGHHHPHHESAGRTPRLPAHPRRVLRPGYLTPT